MKALSGLTALILLAALILAPMPAQARGRDVPHLDLLVNTTTDAVDANIGDGVCDSSAILPGNQCPLRAAIQEANAYNGALDYVKIVVPAGTYTLTVTGHSEDAAATGDLDITNPNKHILIEGDYHNYPVINANRIDRVFDVWSDADVEFRYLVITGGRAQASAAQGGGINNRNGVVELYRVIIQDNEVMGTEDANVGGGIRNGGTMTINVATVKDNFAHRGGGIFNAGASSLKIWNSAVHGNRGNSVGGLESYGPAYLTNCTVSGNISLSNNVGGIWNNADMWLANVTVANNKGASFSPANIYNAGSAGSLHLKYTILARSSAGIENCSGSDLGSDGYNIADDASCDLTQASDRPSTDPRLGPLGGHGGETWTHGLRTDSPAVDGGSVMTMCTNYESTTISTDQRGVDRSIPCDIGAFEGTVQLVFVPFVRR